MSLESDIARYNELGEELTKLLDRKEDIAVVRGRLHQTICDRLAKTAPVKVGTIYTVVSADRVARAECAYVGGYSTAAGHFGWNAIFVLNGSKSVICRVDDQNMVATSGAEITTTAIFSRDAVTAKYLRSLRTAAAP